MDEQSRKEIEEWLVSFEHNWLDKYPVVSNDAAQFVAVVRDELAAQFMEYRKALEDF